MENTSKHTPRATNWALSGLCIGSALIVIDANVLNVALPSIRTSLSTTSTDFLWILNAYTLVFAVVLLPAGTIANRIGGKKVFLSGLTIFGLASIGCALTNTAKLLILTRIFQGSGASCLAVTGLSLISNLYTDDKKRGYAFGIWSGVSGVGFAGGPLIGGFLINFFSWRAIFYINIPICLFAGLISFFTVPEQDIAKKQENHSLLSLSSFILAMTCFIYTTIQISNSGFTKMIILGYGLTLLIFTVFLGSEKRITHDKSKANIFPPILLKKATIKRGLFASFTYNFGLYGMLFVFTLIFQQTLKNSALQTGILLLPLTLVCAITSYSIASRLLLKYSPQNILFQGMFFSFIGSLLLIWYTLDIHYYIAAVGFILFSFGNGLSSSSMTALVLNNAPEEYQNVSSSLINVARQTGGVIGTSLLGVIVAKTAIMPYTTIAMIIVALIFLLCALYTRKK